MSELPDLDPTQVGYIAYYNVYDSLSIGESDYNPEDLTSASGVVSYNLYDNGWEGQYNIGGRNGTVTARVKSDGWIIVYTSRNESRSYGGDGYYNFLNIDGGSGSSPGLRSRNGFQEAIYDLATNLQNWGTIYSDEYSDSDVGVYHYAYPDATGSTRLALLHIGSDSTTGDFTITENTQLYYNTLSAVAWDDEDDEDSSDKGRVNFNGNNIVTAYDLYSPDTQSKLVDMRDYATLSPGNTFSVSASGEYNQYDSTGGMAHVLFIWGDA